MGFSTPPNFTPLTPLGASSLQVLSDDISYLVNGISQKKQYDKGSDITTTSTTFVAIDSTNLAITVTTVGTKAILIFQGVAINSGGANLTSFDINVNGTRLSSTGTEGRLTITANAVAGTAMIVAVVDGLTPGSNTFQILWKASAGTATLRAGSGTANQDNIPSIDIWGN